MAELFRKESCNKVQTWDSQLWARSTGQEDVGKEERNQEEEEEEEEEEEGVHWEARGGVGARARWTNLPGLEPACDER